jgi:hypothetical protein
LEQEPWSSEPARKKRGHLFRHQLLMLVGILFGIVAAVVGADSALASVVLFVLAGLAWMGSGVSAIAGKRHMFGRASAWSGNVKMVPSGHSPMGATVVGGLFVLFGLVLVAFGLRFPLARARAKPWEPCEHVVCPGRFDCGGAGGGAPETRVAACTPLYGGAVCGDGVTATDPTRVTCRGSPASTMHCDLPEGAIDCPALWIEKAPARSIYVAGCCGYDAQGAFCGAPSVEAMRTCERVTPGDQWAPAP